MAGRGLAEPGVRVCGVGSTGGVAGRGLWNIGRDISSMGVASLVTMGTRGP